MQTLHMKNNDFLIGSLLFVSLFISSFICSVVCVGGLIHSFAGSLACSFIQLKQLNLIICSQSSFQLSVVKPKPNQLDYSANLKV